MARTSHSNLHEATGHFETLTKMPNGAHPKEPSPEDIANGVPARVPSILDLKKAIPDHCLQPILSTSFYYAIKDIIMAISLHQILLMVEDQPIVWLKYVFVPFYWFLQGVFFTAIFVVGHDCGHGSFSTSDFINDLVGNVMHSIILTPYYPWKLTHRQHHKNTGNIDKDEVYYPIREKYIKKEVRMWSYFGFGLGWFVYLLRGYGPRSRRMTHFNPNNQFFARHSLQCGISLALMAAWIHFALIPYAVAFGLWALVSHYLIPVFGFACWMVLITFLHHHDEKVPWYADHRWDFVRGQLSSIDRHYGLVHHLIHSIGTHQIHHLFSKVPHYHLEEATLAFRKAYPELVRKSDESVFVAYLRIFKLYAEQIAVPDRKEIHVYQQERAK